ncbi:MAG: hypothetical protein ACRDQ4_23050 [Pseudonocardiaceae bacterium]
MDRSPQDQRRGRHRRKRLGWWWLQPPPAPVTEAARQALRYWLERELADTLPDQLSRRVDRTAASRR